MKRHICTLVGVLMALCLLAPVYAQQQSHELTTGTHFLVGFIHPDRAPGEPLADSSYRIIITAAKGARVAVGSRMFTAEPNLPLEVKLPVTSVINVTSDRPITVVSRQAMLGNGEQSWHLPVSAWGTSYRPFAWWTDRYGLDSASLVYSSAQRLIIAAHDETKVTAQTLRGTIDTILNAGQSWLVREDIDTGSYRSTASDPTGLLITATKPIGVVSGHTKAAVLAYPDGLPMTGPYARSANRCRGNLQDAMLPATMGGTEFVTVPMIYTPTRERGLDLRDQGIGDDRGDVVRFVALEDSTVVIRMTPTGNPDTAAILGRGNSWMDTHVEQATAWRTSRPVLCAQYGKSYGHITSQTVRPEDDPSTDAGMPLLMTVPGTDRWTSHATLQTFSETFNALSLVVRTADLPYVRINNIVASSWGKHSALAGSPFTTMRLVLPHGAYTVAADSGRTFCCWTYGSLDGFQLGRIYGSVAGMDMRNACPDSVSLSVNIAPDSATAVASVSSSNTPCSEIAMLYLDDAVNIDWERRDSVVVMRHRDTRSSARG
ncbi:MAG: IgGFc-binding protein, partial [Candidatus Kapaibacterium sp.]